MTDAPTNRGVLTDKEGAGFPGCRIMVDGEQQDRPFVVLNFVQKYLDAIPKKARVCFTTKDGKISKIWEDKPAATQQGNTSEKCTSPEKPAAAANTGTGLKTVEGQIVAIDHQAHKITVKDRAGASHTFIWPPQFNDVMGKLKQWWFTKITGEQEKDFPDLWRMTAQDFFKRPDDWPASQHHGGGRPFQPRNEKPIVYQVCYKEACETMRAVMLVPDHSVDEVEYNRLMDIALARAKKDAEDLCKAAGVQ